jgi:hypothetical protein
MHIPIKRTVEKIPRGFVLVPLVAGAVVHTFLPQTAHFFGSFTGALFEGALPILAVFFVCVGSSIAVQSLPQVVQRGGALLATKIALGTIAGVVLCHFLGADPVRAGFFTGLSTLAVVAAINVPAIAACRRRGWNVEGPFPADTLFFRAQRGDFDLVIAMYHDQGHGPVKVLGLESGVNITIGLPVIRTSVDHGTAFDIAGTGVADERSMLKAIRQAIQLAPHSA